MKLLSAFIVLFLAASPSARTARADLQADVTAAVSTKAAAKGQIGVAVIRLGSDAASSALVASSRADLPLIPASNMKLLTTSAALDKLGGSFRFRTRLFRQHDALVIVGDGDPTLGDAELLKRYGWTTSTMFEQWASMLKSQGIDRVGDVVIDDSVFDEQFVHPNWPADQMHKRYVAQVGGLNFNANCIDFYLTGQKGSKVQYRLDPATAYAEISNACTFASRNAIWLSRELNSNRIVLKGETNAANTEPLSVTVHDPGLFFATAMAEALAKNGVIVAGAIRRDREAHRSSDLKPLAQHETPIEIVLQRANKDSMNLYAECLLKTLGARENGSGGSWQNGAAAVAGFLAGRGIAPEEVTLDDGSGLSKKNRVSANALARVLVSDFFGPNRELFLNTLAVGGVDGTLDNRFRDTLKGRVFAKTGYVSNARCLSGYLKTKKDNWYAFSILVNGPVGAEGRKIQEQLVLAIDHND